MKTSSAVVCILFLCSCNQLKKNDKQGDDVSDQTHTSVEINTKDPGAMGLECSPVFAEKCTEIRSQIEKLEVSLKEATDKNDVAQTQHLSLELGKQRELLQLYLDNHGNDQEKLDALNAKYDTLEKLVDQSQTSLNSTSTDDVRFKPYTQHELSAVAKVFSSFGDLYIKASEIDADGKPVASTVKVKGEQPWSGYWYPSRGREMFAGDDAPLAKLDRLLAQRGLENGAKKIEQDKYDPSSADWSGLCDAWARAAMAEPEPKTAVELDGIRFETSDIKALLIKKYEGFEPETYGYRYYGSAESDGEINDIRPEALHQLIQSVIGKLGKPIGVDDDPGFEVWNKPLFSMRWTAIADTENPDAFLVKAWPRLVRNRSNVSAELTSAFDIKAPVWEYRLYVDRSQQNADGFKVIYGEWMNGSINTHPDTSFVVQNSPEVHPRNKIVANSLGIIDDLLKKSIAH